MAERKHILARALLIFGTVLLSVYLWTQQSQSPLPVKRDVFTPLSNLSYAGYPRAQPDLDHNDNDWNDRIDIGSWLVCMMNQPLNVGIPQQSHWTNYGWVVREIEAKNPDRLKLGDAFNELQISMDADDWTRMDADHEDDTTHNGVLYPKTEAVYRNHYDLRDGVMVAESNFGPEYMAEQEDKRIPKSRLVPLRQ